MISCYPGSHDREQEVTQYWAICGFRKVNIRCLNMSKAKKKKTVNLQYLLPDCHYSIMSLAAAKLKVG